MWSRLSRVSRKRWSNSVASQHPGVAPEAATHGDAFLLHGRRAPIHLAEIPVEQRAPILLACVQKRAFTRSPRRAAFLYFGLKRPTLQDMEKLAPKYPVFLVEQRAVDRNDRLPNSAFERPAVKRVVANDDASPPASRQR